MVLLAVVDPISNTSGHLDCESTMIRYVFPWKLRKNQYALSDMPLLVRTTDTKEQLLAYPSELGKKCIPWQSPQYSGQDQATKTYVWTKLYIRDMPGWL